MASKDLRQSFVTIETRDTDNSDLNQKFLSKQQMETADKYCDEEVDTEITLKAVFSYAPTYLINSLSLMFNRMNPYLLNMISLIFIAFYGSATLTAGFGLGNAVYMFFWQIFTQVNGETQGINCSKAYGAGDWKSMRLCFYRGFSWNIVITIVSVIFYANIDTILLGVGFEPEMTRQAHAMICAMIPALFLQTFNEMFRNYLMSQKVSKPFLWINLASFAVFPFGGYYFIYASGWGVVGFGLLKFVVEFVSLMGLIVTMKFLGHPESLKREPLLEIFNLKDYCQYLRDFGKILMGWYASYFGMEVNTILCGLLKDTIAMNCWVAYMNMFAIIWTIGCGLALTTRTECGTLIGENKPLTARKYAFCGWILANFYAVIAGILVLVLHRDIAYMFTEVPEVLDQMGYQIILLGILTFLIGSGPIWSSVFRIINRSGLYSMILISNQCILSTVLTCILMLYFKLGAPSIGYSYLCGWVSTFTMTLVYAVRFDWSSLKQKQQKINA